MDILPTKEYTPQNFKQAAAVLLDRAYEARKDIVKFVAFAMREENTQERIRCAPHQRILFDFAMSHRHCVIMLPVGHTKTFSMAALGLYQLGMLPTMRGAFVSYTEGQAQKPLGMVKDYIENADTAYPELRIVFPKLRKSYRPSDPWTQSEITIDRPAGIRDASLLAVGFEGAITGARLNWLVVDDLLNYENTLTIDSRNRMYEWFNKSVLSRLDPVTVGGGGRITLTNTAWHPDDLLHRKVKEGWPTLRMEIDGRIEILNTDWDPKNPADLRPETPNSLYCRLTSNDPDPNNETPLWEQRYNAEVIKELKYKHPLDFDQLFRNICRDDSKAMCKQEYIDKCLEMAAKFEHHSMTSKYTGQNITFTGVDLAVSPGEEADDTAFFTFEVLPSGHRKILDIEAGKWSGPVIVDKIFEKQKAYNSIIRVENNACLVPGTPVLTRERGYVAIEDVKVGEHTWTHEKRWRPILELIEGTSKNITPVRIAGSLPIGMTPNHWVYMREQVRTPGRQGGLVRPGDTPEWISVGLANRAAYVATAIPTWPDIDARFELPKTRSNIGASVPVNEELALVLGLYMAEGHSTKRKVFWTLNASERYLAVLIKKVVKKLDTTCAVSFIKYENTLRVRVSSTMLAKAFGIVGKRGDKTLPLTWLGWPIRTRIAIVRGWLLGDGCLKENNQLSEYCSRFFSGTTISRNWLLWVRTTLIEGGYSPTISSSDRKNSVIEGRLVNRLLSFEIRLSSASSHDLKRVMSHEVEGKRWSSSTRACQDKTPIIIDDGHAWLKLKSGPGIWNAYNSSVFNLRVEGDESYTAQDIIVHNAQDYIRQFALARNVSIPVKPHCTGRTKAHPEHGVPALFVEMCNGAWLIPNKQGVVHPFIQRFIDGCLYYVPSKHTDDVIMANFFAREQAKAFGISSGGELRTKAPGVGNMMSR